MAMKLRNMTSVYFVKGDSLLCLYRLGSRVADKMYVGAAGGHFEKEELNDPRACVLREMKEELGLAPEEVCGLQLRYVTQRLKNGEIRQNYFFFARLDTDRPLESSEGMLRWFSFEEIPGLNIPVSAKHMLLHYIREGRFSGKLYGGITEREATRFVALEEF